MFHRASRACGLINLRSFSIFSSESAFRADGRDIGRAVAESFKLHAPEAAAQSVIAQLGPAQRSVLVAALLRAEGGEEIQRVSPAYVEAVLKASDVRGPPGTLDA
jgi:hypothetical protein